MDFNKALQTKDTDFEHILEIMKLKRDPEEVDSARNLLVTINLIIEYYCEREDESLKVAITYFPLCNDDIQVICEEFVCLKFGLYTSQEWKNHISKILNHKVLYMPSDELTKKQRDKLQKSLNDEKKIHKILDKTKDEIYSNGKTIIYSNHLYKSRTEYLEASKTPNKNANKHWYLSNTIVGFEGYKESACPLVLAPSDYEDLYTGITEDEGANCLENLVIFPMQTPDGRYSDYCSEAFQKSYLDDYVEVGSGLKNVFVFSFSRKPYRLRRLFDVKQRMKERLQIIDEESFDFITFTYDEALKLTNQEKENRLIIPMGKQENELQQDYETIIDDITNGLDRYVSRRNEMSLCIPSNSIDSYSKQLVDETEADDTLVSTIFQINKDLWEDEVETKIRHFVFNEKICVITGNDISSQLKNGFRSLLVNQYGAKEVTFGTFGDLRGYSKNGQYLNTIKSKRVIVVSFRNDYTESIFHKYPNSFDPFCINPDQMLLEISNYFFMRQYYDWGRYKYGKAIRTILKSKFRETKMKPLLVDYKRPTKKLLEDTREEETDRNSGQGHTVQYKVVLEDDTIHSYNRSEWMLYEYGGSKGTTPLSDLKDLYESCEGLKIQPLTPLVRAIYKSRIDSQKDIDNKSERLFKEQKIYDLNDSEIKSDVQLWKILLAKKVAKSSLSTVYNEIMSHFNESNRISQHSFARWLEADYGIPRARKMQKYVVENYLGIKPPYINLIRRIKERTKNDTETISISIRHFLNMALLNKNYQNVYSGLSDEIKDLLGISKPEDIEAIISEINDKIKFESVKNIG